QSSIAGWSADAGRPFRATIVPRFSPRFRDTKMNKLQSLSLALALACLAGGSLAQEITGSIVGTVVDATGSAIPGAKITVTNIDRNAVIRTAETDANGNYTAPFLPIGAYSIAVEQKGFKKSVQNNITLNVNDKLTINLKMEVGDVIQEVSVQASA